MSEEELVRYLREKGLMHRERTCNRGHAMKLTCARSGHSAAWKCRVGGCCQEVSVRRGTWLDGPRMRTPLKTAVLFIYDWCRQISSVTNCERDLGKTILNLLYKSNHTSAAVNHPQQRLQTFVTAKTKEEGECFSQVKRIGARKQS
uniref:Uncharacterized protein n=1 Tax=Trichuris muris TaxID=70415 RepID=A0A5S6R0I5_TRIMR